MCLASKYIYMKVSEDKYQLPIAIADTVVELAKMCGTKPNCISSCISHAKKKNNKTSYIKVEVDY